MEQLELGERASLTLIDNTAERQWWTSDTHFGHQRILKLGNGRPFATVGEMNEVLIDNWNSRVHPRDIVYFLGDFSFMNASYTNEVISRLRGRIHFIYGNHDGKRMDAGMSKRFEWYGAYKEVTIRGQKICLAHYPFLEWNRCHKGSWMLHGHQHQNGEGRASAVPRIDVGVDGWDFTPVSFEQISDEMKGKVWTPISHH